MSNASNLSTLANVLDDGSDGQFLKSTGSGGVAFDTVAAGAVVYATADLLPLSGNSAGDMAYVTSSNRFYINNGSGWYSVSLVNTNPNITSVADASSNTTPFTLATDGTATVITVTAADPEEVPLTYGYSVTSGSLNGSTVAQGTGSNTNVFTVTPHASQDATFTITFTASDGINQATSANAFSLSFVTIVTDSNHTTLLASVASNSPYSLPSANNQVSSFSVGAQTSSPTEVVFGDSGTKMFVLSSDRYVYSYSVSTAYDASTASYVATSSELTQFSTNTSESFRFKPDGTVMFVSGSNGYVYQYSLTAWDVSTIAYASKSVQHASHAGSYKAITFKPDGTRIYMSSLRYVMSMTLSSPWDLANHTTDNTSAGFTNAYLNLGWVYGNTITGMDFNSTGTSLTMVYGNNSSDKYIIEHPIDDAWNVSNATVLGSAPTTTYQQNSIQGLAYANDGNTLVTVLDTGDTVYTYDTGMSGINNNIKDASTNSHSITVNGDAHAGSFSPYRSGGYAVEFDSSDYLTIASHSDFAFGSGAFTIQFWIKPLSWNNCALIDFRPNSTNGPYPTIQLSGSGQLGYYKDGGGFGISQTSTTQLTLNEWQHIIYQRSGTTGTLYRNGSSIGSWSDSTNYSQSLLRIAYHAHNGAGFIGQLSNVRITTASDTVEIPTTPLTANSDTVFLGCSLPYFGDSNSTPKTITVSSDPKIVAVGPYDYTEYSATDHGGSVYFDGTGDTLEIPHSTNVGAFGTNDFTVQLWYYTEAIGSQDYLIDFRQYGANGDYLSISKNGSNKIVVAEGGSNRITGTKNISVGQWFFITVHRDSGSLKLFVNGEQDGSTYSDSTNYVAGSSNNFIIGKNNGGASYLMQGYLSDIRVTHGSALDGTTVPTAPLSSSGAELHIKGTDASIIDKSQSANLNLFGSTTGSTTQAKFVGSKSMYFDGSGDGILCKGTQIPTGATESWTIEAWAYVTDTSTERQIFAQYSAGSSSTRFVFGVESAKFRVFNGGTSLYSLNAVSLNTWTYVAVTYNGSAAELYVDGISQGTLTLNRGVDDVDLQIGARNQGATQPWIGYIQDARVTKGLVRYTANFTPPSAPLEG